MSLAIYSTHYWQKGQNLGNTHWPLFTHAGGTAGQGKASALDASDTNIQTTPLVPAGYVAQVSGVAWEVYGDADVVPFGALAWEFAQSFPIGPLATRHPPKGVDADIAAWIRNEPPDCAFRGAFVYDTPIVIPGNTNANVVVAFGMNPQRNGPMLRRPTRIRITLFAQVGPVATPVAAP